MTDKDISKEFRLKKVKKMNNHFINELDRNELLINRNKKFCTTLNYIKHFRTLIFGSYCINFHFRFCFFSRYF